jgi:single-strand DNA-binding protein
MDKYTFTGNIGNDPESKIAANGSTMVTFSVAIDKSYKDRNGQKVSKTKWISCTKFIDQGKTWGVLPFVKRGTKVLIEGEPEARAWTNAAGEANAALNVQVLSLELVGSAPQAGATNAAPQPQATPQATPPISTPAQANWKPTPEEQAAIDDLPF